jgi:hypothetical protein
MPSAANAAPSAMPCAVRLIDCLACCGLLTKIIIQTEAIAFLEDVGDSSSETVFYRVES